MSSTLAKIMISRVLLSMIFLLSSWIRISSSMATPHSPELSPTFLLVLLRVATLQALEMLSSTEEFLSSRMEMVLTLSMFLPQFSDLQEATDT